MCIRDRDTSGETLEERTVTVTADDMRAALPRFLGEIGQIPPMYSAIKVNGQKLYDPVSYTHLVDVRRQSRGPQVVISRTHPGLVKRLFELEVPRCV